MTARLLPITTWHVTLQLPGGTVAHAWSSQPTFAAAAWNGSLPAGGSTELGFQGTGDPTPSAVSCW